VLAGGLLIAGCLGSSSHGTPTTTTAPLTREIYGSGTQIRSAVVAQRHWKLAAGFTCSEMARSILEVKKYQSGRYDNVSTTRFDGVSLVKYIAIASSGRFRFVIDTPSSCSWDLSIS
jgi:hypothetical protein